MILDAIATHCAALFTGRSWFPGSFVFPDDRRKSHLHRFGTQVALRIVRPGGGDGQVPYASAHHPGAVSELIVHSGHYCLEDSRVIKEVGRIFKEHATP